MSEEKLSAAYELIQVLVDSVGGIVEISNFAQATMDEYPLNINSPQDLQIQLMQAREGILLEAFNQVAGVCKTAIRHSNVFAENLSGGLPGNE